MSFPRYERYKDSGVEWLGEIPEHWKILALKRIVRLQSGDMIAAERIETAGSYPVFGGNGIRGFTENFNHDGNFVLIGRQGALCGNVTYASGRFWASEHAVVAHPIKTFEIRWFGELLRAMNLGQYSLASAQPGLSVEAISRLHVPVPPKEEMRTIANFLDRETAKIDALIQEQQRLIELLKEKRQAAISHAVTKGLDPTVPMKDSGVESIAGVPSHWRVARLKYVSPDITVGIVIEPSKYYCESGIPALRSLNIRAGAITNIESLVFISEESNKLLAKSKLRKGDLVAVRSGEPGATAVITEELDGCNCIDLIIIRRPDGHNEHFLEYFLNSDCAVRQFSEGSGGAMQKHFNIGEAKNMVVSLPPAPEQASIVEYLNAATARFDHAISQCEQSTDLLQERRAALISAAVTGKIDVGNYTQGHTAVTEEIYEPA